jgi:cysteine synthase
VIPPVATNLFELVGNTPLVEVENIFAKLETYNPSGSIKDRMVSYMIQKAIRSNKLKTNSKIIEATTGNTGISLAMFSANLNFKFTAVMPEHMSKQRKQIMRQFGANLVQTPKEEDIMGAINKYGELIKTHSDAWRPMQFENKHNFEAHEFGLGKELVSQLPTIDAFVAGFGTGGTLIGVAKALKKHSCRWIFIY